jgi:hypothetical protein
LGALCVDDELALHAIVLVRSDCDLVVLKSDRDTAFTISNSICLISEQIGL